MRNIILIPIESNAPRIAKSGIWNNLQVIVRASNVYGTFKGKAISYEGEEVNVAGAKYQTVTLDISKGKKIARNVQVMDYLLNAFQNGRKGQYFYAQAKGSLPENLYMILIYAVITEDGEYIFEREIFEEAEHSMQTMLKSANRSMKIYFIVSILLIPLIIGIPMLIATSFGWWLKKKLLRKTSHFYDLTQIEKELTSKGFDLKKSS